MAGPTPRKKRSDGLVDVVDGYVRISDDARGLELGVDRQEREIAAMVASRGQSVRKFHRDNDISATSGKTRPGFEDLLAARPAVIAVWHTDRLVRTFKDLERVIDLGSRVIAVEAGDLDLDTPSGRTNARLLTTVAQFEGEHKAARQRAANWQRATDRKLPWWSRRPFGLTQKKVGDKVVFGHHKAEAAALREAHEAVLLGRPLARIADDWNRAGLLTNTGKPWTGMTARPVLMHPRNAGLMTYHGEVVGPALWEPIVPEAMHLAVVRHLSADGRKLGGGGERTGLLSGLVRCYCGSTVRIGWRGRRGEPGSYRIYDCKDGHHVTPRADWLDKLVGMVVVERLARPDAALLLLAEDAPDLDGLREEAERLQGELLDLERLARPDADPSERLSVQQVARMGAPFTARIEEIRVLLGESTHAPTLTPFVGADDVQEVWDDATDTQRRAVIAALYRITLLPGVRGRPMTPERVQFEPVR